MSDFITFRDAVQQQLRYMASAELYVVNSESDERWRVYIDSYPAGTNLIHKTTTEYDCNECRHFIRDAGNIVAIKNGELISIWDVEVGYPFQAVADALSQHVKGKKIKGIFRHFSNKLGKDITRSITAAEEIVEYNHFYEILDSKYVIKESAATSRESVVGNITTKRYTLKRALEELTEESIITVLDLIRDNNLYKGEEYKALLEDFQWCKDSYMLCSNKDIFTWTLVADFPKVCGVRSSLIGSLLIDLSKGDAVETAVNKYESKADPRNFKRSRSIVTQATITAAQEKINDLGLESALYRRYATAEDVTINNVLFADRSVMSAMSAFDELKKEVVVSISDNKNIQEVSVDDFMRDILPNAESIELLVENSQANNLVSLIAPRYSEAGHLFKWDNNFSWAYNGDVTDSIKERVKKAGGNVEGVLRCSLSWFNTDDYDLHVIEPKKNRIFYGKKTNVRTGGNLDVDMNVNSNNASISPVENITWPYLRLMQEGTYQVIVNNYTNRNSTDYGFELEIEYEGKIQRYAYNKFIAHKKNVQAALFTFSNSRGIEYTDILPSVSVTRQVWGISTQTFTKVNMIMNSPNHWDGNLTGNRHWFFMLEGCANPEPSRGFFNEYLKHDLNDHRKVFEVLGGKMLTPVEERQLSGLGFSSTRRASVTCRVKGKQTRLFKINF